MSALRFILSTAALAAVFLSRAETLSLTWEPVTNAVQYRVYWGVAPLSYTNWISTAGTFLTVSNLVEGQRYHFTVTAVDDQGREGQPAEEVIGWTRFATNFPSGPALHLSGNAQVMIEHSTNLLTWQPFTEWQPANGADFFRLKWRVQ